ncbi:MAG TPA: hypothetical protein VNA19_16615 [Pyrinomonadaceae bacterium]|jgi:hypothetical protein|nr:hypothetical protein [Pyrinomonadaceae bacterium]
MQNFPNHQTPSDARYGGPVPAKKSGLSKGCIIGIIAAVLFCVAGIVLVVVGVVGAYWLKRQAPTVANANSTRVTTTSTSSRGATTGGAESPSPTSAQSAAVAGGQSATWEQQEVSWTVPQKWRKHSADSQTFLWRSPGSWDAASLIVSISPMSADFPAETSLKAFYTGAQTRKQNGEVNELRWLTLGGVRGIQFRESAPEDADSPQRLQWMAYRKYKGQLQLVNIILAARGKDFARHEDALYGILYTTNFSQ